MCCRPRSVHFPSAPTRTREILQQIDRIDEELRQGTAGQEDEGWDPELIWEPFPVSPEMDTSSISESSDGIRIRD